MSANKYAFDLLFRHSNNLAQGTKRSLKQPIHEARKLFAFRGRHFAEIESEAPSLTRNVKLALTARFINHQFAQLMLIERSLLLDAFNCSRSALETTAFYWLVVKEPASAALYDADTSPRPIEIRGRLETLGVDISPLRELYNLQSEVAHVGNKTDGLQIAWERELNGRLMVGGGGDENVQRALLVGMIKSVFRFVKHDEQYEVPDLDEILPDF